MSLSSMLNLSHLLLLLLLLPPPLCPLAYSETWQRLESILHRRRLCRALPGQSPMVLSSSCSQCQACQDLALALSPPTLPTAQALAVLHDNMLRMLTRAGAVSSLASLSTPLSTDETASPEATQNSPVLEDLSSSGFPSAPVVTANTVQAVKALSKISSLLEIRIEQVPQYHSQSSDNMHTLTCMHASMSVESQCTCISFLQARSGKIGRAEMSRGRTAVFSRVPESLCLYAL